MTEFDFEAYKLQEYDYWSVYLHEDQRYLGRSYIALGREGDIDPFTETTHKEQSELLIITSGLKRVLDDLYQPTRLNYSNLRNTWKHCHWHVVPRYDTPRTAHGVSFVDENIGHNWSPYSRLRLPKSVLTSIKTDISTGLEDLR